MKKLIWILVPCLIALSSCNTRTENPSNEKLSIESSSEGSGDKVLIRLKPPQGTTQHMTVTLNVKSEDEEDEMSVNMVSKMDVSVVDQQDTVNTFEMRYKSMKMSIRAGAMEMEYDSESNEQNSMSAILDGQMKALLEKPVFMKMDQMGRLIEMHLPGNITKEQTGDLSSFAVPLPEQAVGMGDSWTAKKQVENYGELDMTMTIDKITVDAVQIKVKGFINTNDGENPSEIDGVYQLDRKTGMTKDGQMNMQMNMTGKKMKTIIEFKST